MISRMDKYTFLLYHAEVDSFLEELQQLGLVDIEREERAIDDHSQQLYSLLNRYKTILRALPLLKERLEIEVEEREITSYNFEGEPLELLEHFEELLTGRREVIERISKLERELNESKVWGTINQEDVDKIESLGYRLNYYTVNNKGFKPEWEEKWPIHILNEIDTQLYFVIISREGEELNFDLNSAKSPSRTYQLVEEELKNCRKVLETTSSTLLSLYNSTELLKVGERREWEKLELYLAGASSQEEVEGKLALLKGFATTEQRDRVEKQLEERGYYYLMEEATEEDNPPISLKNNFFARLYEPIGELYMLPRYGELDLTPYFALFYMLFFGMCLGDMGYGLTLIVVGGVAKLKLPKFKSYLSLAQFLGLGAVIMASLSGSFFGANITEVLRLPKSIGELLLDNTQLFWFAILFGIVQIIFGRLINAIYSISTKGWQYGMSNIGWSIVIVWATWFYATTMGSITIPEWMHYIALLGASLILLFSSDNKNIFIRLFKGGAAFYDITGFFGDMLSYIRLFGLGAAGAILGMVVNSVAFSLGGVPYIGWLFTLIMLLFGHTLVLLLSALGAFVHPMRLTFVEFYKNAGFEGGGRAFRPLSKAKE